jgi:ribulose-5-phosphate 4-epimerase/fuculose-1-phosphate aldolase
MTETELRHEIVRVGLSLYQRGYVHATAGNISCRLPDGGFLITPTDACLGLLRAEGIARIDAEGRHVAGDRPSKTLALHRHIYAQDAQANCVIHTHSTHLVALTLSERAPGTAERPPSGARTGVAAALGAVAGFQAGAEDAEPEAPDLLPPITPYFVMKVGHVPLIPYHRPGDPAAGILVAAGIRRAQERGAPIRAVMLERLGPNVWGPDPAQAMATLEELEETARLWLLSGGRVAPLQPAQIEDLRQAFGARW